MNYNKLAVASQTYLTPRLNYHLDLMYVIMYIYKKGDYMTSQVITAATARSIFFEILDKVSKLRQVFTITKKGTATAVIMSADEFEEWAETLEIMAHSKTVKGIKKGLKELKSGKHVSHKEIFKKLS